MKKFVLAIAFMGTIILSGCATTDKNKNPGVSSFTADLIGDGGTQVVEVEDKTVSGKGSGIEVVAYLRGKEKKKIDSISLSGKFIKVDFIQLNTSNDQQQIALYSRGDSNTTNLVIYRLQNNIFSKMFDATSEYGINLDNMGAITRIKIGKAQSHGSSDSPNVVNDWESWVWTGEKFITE